MIQLFVYVIMSMYVHICITFYDKIIVCAGSVDLKGIKRKQKVKLKRNQKFNYCLVKICSVFVHIKDL